MHLFFNYPFSLNAIPCLAGHSTDLGDEETRLHNIEAILKSYTVEDRERIMCCWYEIWHRRNLKWLGKPTTSAEQAAETTRIGLETFKRAKEEAQDQHGGGRQARWKKLEASLVKINVDDAIFFAGFGIIIQDHNGTFIFEKSMIIQGVSDHPPSELGC